MDDESDQFQLPFYEMMRSVLLVTDQSAKPLKGDYCNRYLYTRTQPLCKKPSGTLRCVSHTRGLQSSTHTHDDNNGNHYNKNFPVDVLRKGHCRNNIISTRTKNCQMLQRPLRTTITADSIQRLSTDCEQAPIGRKYQSKSSRLFSTVLNSWSVTLNFWLTFLLCILSVIVLPSCRATPVVENGEVTPPRNDYSPVEFDSLVSFTLHWFQLKLLHWKFCQ